MESWIGHHIFVIHFIILHMVQHKKSFCLLKVYFYQILFLKAAFWYLDRMEYEMFFFVFRNKTAALQMAEVQCDVIQPSLRPRRASARRKGVASAENVSKDENLASVQWTVLNTENKKWYKKNKKKKRQEVAAAVGATISAATAAPQECGHAKSAGGAGSSGVADSQDGFQVRSAGAPPAAVVLDPQQKYVLEQNYIFLLEKVSYLLQ